MNVAGSSGPNTMENTFIILESDDDEDNKTDDDLIIVGMSPATISSDDDDDKSSKTVSDDDDIVFIASKSPRRPGPRHDMVKAEARGTPSVSAVSGFTGYDPFGKSDMTDTSDDDLLYSSIDIDKNCNWDTKSDLNTHTVPDITGIGLTSVENSAENLDATILGSQANTQDAADSSETRTATDNLIKIQVFATAVPDTKPILADDASACEGKASGDELNLLSKTSDTCTNALLTSGKDPMISGQSSDSVDINTLLHQLKTLAECSTSSVTTTDVKATNCLNNNCDQTNTVNSARTKPQCASYESQSLGGCVLTLKRKPDSEYPRILPRKKERCDSSDSCSSMESTWSCSSDSDSSLTILPSSPTNTTPDTSTNNPSSSNSPPCSFTTQRVLSKCRPCVGSFRNSVLNKQWRRLFKPCDSSKPPSMSGTSNTPSCSNPATTACCSQSHDRCPPSACSNASSRQDLKLIPLDLNGISKGKMPLMPIKARLKLNKQSFSGSETSPTCSSCGKENATNSFSTCLQGHFTCKTCLEKSAKALLTNSKTRSLRCTYANCDSLFSRDALRQTLPPILVEILDERLDQEAVAMVLQVNKHPQTSAASASTSGQPHQGDESSSSGEDSFSISEEDAKSEKDAEVPSSPSALAVPAHWQPMESNPKDSYQLVPLEGGCEENLKLAILFHNTMFFPRADIKRIYRVQNPILWQFFTVKKSQMQQQQGTQNVDERQLFHGTNADVVHAICKNNFDWRLCGVHGTVYGQGSYFARDASYSNMYTEHRGGHPAKDLLSLLRKNQLNKMFKNQLRSGQPGPPMVGGPPTQQALLARKLQALLALHSGGNLPVHQPYYLPFYSHNPPTSAHNSGQPMNLSTSQPLNLSVGLSPQGPSNPVASTSTPAASTSYHPNSHFQNFPSQHDSTESNEPYRYMFIARVLVGQYTQGKNHYRKPPPLDPYNPYGRCFDSCVDNTSDPKIFVIFESAQCYPEYIVEYINKPRLL